MKLTIRLAIAGAVLATVGLGVGSALGGGFPPPQDCSISGAGLLGTLIPFPEDNRGEYTVEIERDGRVLVSSGRNSHHQLARDPSPAAGDGEVFRGYHNGVLVLGPDRGEGYDCGTDTTVTPTTAPPVEPPTTTVPPDGPSPGPEPEPEPVTTTTIPGLGTAEGCVEGQHQIGETDDGLALCAADAEGG